MLERLRLRTLSFFAHLSPDELEEQAFAAWSRLLPQILVHQHLCFLSRCSRLNGVSSALLSTSACSAASRRQSRVTA